jgi:hypothetical protein
VRWNARALLTLGYCETTIAVTASCTGSHMPDITLRNILAFNYSLYCPGEVWLAAPLLEEQESS